MDVGEVLDDLVNRADPSDRRRAGRPPSRSMRRLTTSSLAVDYREPEQLFVVTVERVVRHRIGPDEPANLGELDELQVQLVHVVVGNEVEVHLQLKDDARRRQRYEDYLKRWRAWEQLRAAGPRDDPPETPAQRLTGVALSVTDDSGTAYRHSHGEYGGTGTEFQGMWGFGPKPPPTATALTIMAHVPGADPVRFTLALPGAQTSTLPPDRQ